MRNPLRAAVQLVVIVAIAGALALGGVLWKASHFHLFNSGPSAAKVAGEAQAIGNTQAKLDGVNATARTAEQQAQGEQTAQAKQGQQYVAATGKVLQLAAPAAKADPAVILAGRLNDKAAGALAEAVGPLTAEQSAWVEKLIRDATSASEEKRAAAEQSLSVADIALRESASREQTALGQARTARAEADQLAAEKKTLQTDLATTLAEKSTLAERANEVIRWALYFGIAYVAIAYLLPLLGLAFPALKPIASAAHAILAPLAAKAKSEAESLARDACASVHHMGQLIAAKAPQLAAEADKIKAEWITEADGTAARADAALRSANVL